MDRSVATAAGTGSLSGVLLSALAQSLASPAPFDPCPICLDLPWAGPGLLVFDLRDFDRHLSGPRR